MKRRRVSSSRSSSYSSDETMENTDLKSRLKVIKQKKKTKSSGLAVMSASEPPPLYIYPAKKIAVPPPLTVRQDNQSARNATIRPALTTSSTSLDQECRSLTSATQSNHLKMKPNELSALAQVRPIQPIPPQNNPPPLFTTMRSYLPSSVQSRQSNAGLQQLHQIQMQQQQQIEQHQRQIEQHQQQRKAQQQQLAQMQLQQTVDPPANMFPNTPLGQARKHLQSEIFSALELGQHFIGKLNSLVASDGYTNAQDYNTVKDNYFHLSHIYDYTIQRMKTLQKRCKEDLKRLDAANALNTLAYREPKCKSEDDDSDDE